jgi:hypothetical protein
MTKPWNGGEGGGGEGGGGKGGGGGEGGGGGAEGVDMKKAVSHVRPDGMPDTCELASLPQQWPPPVMFTPQEKPWPAEILAQRRCPDGGFAAPLPQQYPSPEVVTPHAWSPEEMLAQRRVDAQYCRS